MTYDLDALIRRQLYLQRYANGYTNDILALYKSGDKELVNLIRDFFDDASEKDISALLKNNKNNENVKTFLDSITSVVVSQQADIAEFAQSEMLLLSESEVKYTYNALGSISESYPSSREILKQPILGVSDVATTWAVINSSNLARVISGIKNAAQDNLNPVETVRGTKVQQYKDGILWTRNRHSMANANTQVNGVAGNSRSAAYDRFEFKKVVVSATLDYRTTTICRGRDGKVYNKDEAPQTPYHFRCRTQLLPWLGEQTERPFVETDKSIQNLSQKERDELGYGKTTRTYKEFFADQTDAVQLEILGRGRYDLYKSGKYQLDDFYNDQTGKIYTLEELNSL